MTDERSGRVERKNARQGRPMARWAVPAVLALVLSAAAASSRFPDQPPVAVAYQVQPGDTLWELAAATGADRFDRRELVWMLKEVNGLRSSTLQPGQVVLIPNGERSTRAACRRPAAFGDAAVISRSSGTEGVLPSPW